MPSVSIIIPAKNEEKFLPRLLASIKSQTLQPLEVIVADNHSSDKTPQIAKDAGAFLIEGGPTFAGRNNGAKIARGDIFVFIDADTFLPDSTTLETAVSYLESQGLDAATSTLKLDDESRSRLMTRFFYYLIGGPFLQFSNVFNKPLTGGGPFIICKRDVFNKVNGFSPMLHGEDRDFAKKIIGRGYKFKTLSLWITTSGRRYHGFFKATGGVSGALFFGLLVLLGLSHKPKLVTLVHKIYDWPAKT